MGFGLGSCLKPLKMWLIPSPQLPKKSFVRKINNIFSCINLSPCVAPEWKDNNGEGRKSKKLPKTCWKWGIFPFAVIQQLQKRNIMWFPLPSSSFGPKSIYRLESLDYWNLWLNLSHPFWTWLTRYHHFKCLLTSSSSGLVFVSFQAQASLWHRSSLRVILKKEELRTTEPQKSCQRETDGDIFVPTLWYWSLWYIASLD